MAALVADCDADIVVGGHTHEPTDRMVGNIRVLNGGSVGLPRRAAGAGWLLMEADGAGVDVHHRVVAFDVEAVIEDLWGRRHPNASFVESILRRRHAFAR